MLTSRQQYYFALSIPLINVIANSTHGFSPRGIFSPGYVRTYLILFFIFLYFNKFYRNNRLNNVILITLIYYFILGFFSSDFTYSQSVFLKYFMTSMMLPIGYYYFNTIDRFKKLLNVYIAMLGVYLFFIVLANIFGLGTSDYAEETIYFGAGRVNMTKAMMILVLMAPLTLKFEKNRTRRIIYTIIYIISLIFILLGVKRGAILGLTIGSLGYSYLLPNKTKVIKTAVVLGTILILASPLYYDTLIKRVSSRQEAGRFDVEQAKEEEGRFIEFYQVTERLSKGDIVFKLFGEEFFNSPALSKTGRMLHTDYMSILNGSGIIGLLLFLMIYFIILRNALYYYKIFKYHIYYREIAITVLAILFAVLVVGISGTVTSLGLRSIVFMFWGASLSVLNEKVKMIRSNQHS